MPNTGNTGRVTRRLGDLRRRNRPNQRRNHNHTPSRGTHEAPQVPVVSRIFTSASESSPFNPNAECQPIHGRRGALQAASTVTGQMSLQSESVALENGQPIAHQSHTNELEVTPNEIPIDPTSIDQLETSIDQLETRIEQLLQQLSALQEDRPPTNQDETNAQRATPNNRPTLFPGFPPSPILGRPSLDPIQATHQNTTWQIRKAAVEDLLLSVDESWENIDPCFCGDPYVLMTAAGEGHAPAKMPTCGHVFGRACIALWLQEKNTCPMCRDKVALPWVGRDFLMGVD
ncbi:hypothetical protein OCU04_010367 [Sclerotinia nivalis]|uniref:RING-type domain-containing protein n=1 Tax=Sclerotinia nivalis TaxID=352851 RepID=A0A9X0AEE3_9HELO|nr:hypothetical protein OCU04_010367 [Sclerotinia nivalis]